MVQVIYRRMEEARSKNALWFSKVNQLEDEINRLKGNVAVENIDASKVNRFEVIDENGRAMDRLGVSVQVVVQDDGRTLKVFIRGE
jgi:uncharacterized protein YabE (DUF348 family)